MVELSSVHMTFILKMVENIVANEEIAHCDKVFLFATVFSIVSALEASESFCMWESVMQFNMNK